MVTPLPDTGFTDSSHESKHETENILEQMPDNDSPGGVVDIDIEVLGTSFSITASGSPEYLNEVLSQYKFMIANTQNISGMRDPLKVAILTGFILCDEINQLKLQSEKIKAQVEERLTGESRELDRITEKLIARIDRVFQNTQSPDG